MNILILGCKDFPPFSSRKLLAGGMETYTYNIVEKLVNNGFNFTIVSGKDENLAEEEELCDGKIKVYRTRLYGGKILQPITLFLGSFKKSLKLFKKVHLINPQTPLSGIIGILGKIAFKKKLVTTSHAFNSQASYTRYWLFSPLYSIAELLCYKMADKIISVSKTLTDYLCRKYKLDREKFVQIPSGIDPNLKSELNSEKTEKIHKKYGLSNSSFKIIFLGRLIPYKGIKEFVKAIPIILESHNNVQFIIAGEGPLTNWIKTYRIRNNIPKEKMILTGRINNEEKFYLLNISNLLILPSWNEAYPIVVLEAIGLGLPFIVTPVGDLPIIIKSSKAGLLTERGNPKSIAERAVFLAKNSNFLENMEKACYEFIKDQTWEKQSQKYADTLKDTYFETN